ncbi:MAG TPA: NAD-dependent epimerase/dehydratase family protein [Solirubrobacteraceae bacterium]
MPTTLLTGGAGLVGSQVARMLVQRGDRVRLTVRERTNLENLDFEHEAVRCDILDRRAVRRAMRGVQRVFHLAGSTSLRAPIDALFRINVEGTRIVLEEALRAGVERVVYTSSIAAVGPAPRGTVADESQIFRGGYGLPYMDSKHEAEVEALRLAARGLPVVIVNPAFVFGAGDVNRSSTELVRRFLRREIPAYVDGALNVVDVKDVARGHLLADEHGRLGERYILGNRNFIFERLLADLGRISGVEPPAIKMPIPVAIALTEVLEALPGRLPVTAGEVRTVSQWWAYSSAKAKRELGYSPGHHEDTLLETIEWYRDNEERLAAPGARQAIPLRLLGFAFRRADSVIHAFGEEY